MAKIITDDGLVATALKPFRLPNYHPLALPDAAACTNALIVVNDSAKSSRPYVAVSFGSEWLPVMLQPDMIPNAVDLTPIVRSAVSEMLPARIASARALAAPMVEASPVDPQAALDTQAIAQGLLEMSEAINRLSRENHDLQQRVAFLEANALARAQIVREAS